MYRSLSLWLGIVAFSSGALAPSTLSTTCYYKASGTEHMSDGGPCGVVSSDSQPFSCCAVGDMCLEDGLCHYTHAFPTNGSATGFYVGGCTDQGLNSNATHSTKLIKYFQVDDSDEDFCEDSNEDSDEDEVALKEDEGTAKKQKTDKGKSTAAATFIPAQSHASKLSLEHITKLRYKPHCQDF